LTDAKRPIIAIGVTPPRRERDWTIGPERRGTRPATHLIRREVWRRAYGESVTFERHDGPAVAPRPQSVVGVSKIGAIRPLGRFWRILALAVAPSDTNCLAVDGVRATGRPCGRPGPVSNRG
jgi:hypothetical protein